MDHLVHAHWYYLLIGLAVSYFTNKYVEDALEHPNILHLPVVFLFSFSASVLTALGLFAIFNISVVG